MELKDLVGRHKFSGVDLGKDVSYVGEEYSNSVSFILDGITYLALEDPDDGWRSSMRDIKVSNQKVDNVFQAIEVMATMRSTTCPDGIHENHEVLEIYDTANGKLLLAVGTGNFDDYYPYWVCEWHPENMHINE